VLQHRQPAAGRALRRQHLRAIGMDLLGAATHRVERERGRLAVAVGETGQPTGVVVTVGGGPTPPLPWGCRPERPPGSARSARGGIRAGRSSPPRAPKRVAGLGDPSVPRASARRASRDSAGQSRADRRRAGARTWRNCGSGAPAAHAPGRRGALPADAGQHTRSKEPGIAGQQDLPRDHCITL
jgi:hypothetical protein